MVRFYRMLSFAGVLVIVLLISAAAQTPSGLPNTPPSSGQPPEGSSATSAGRTTSSVSTGASNSNATTGVNPGNTGTPSTSTTGGTATGNSNPVAASAGSSNGSAKAGQSTTTGQSNSNTKEDSENKENPDTSAGTTPPLPTTTILPGAKAGEKDPTSDVADLLAPGPLPKEKLSLIGGTVKKIDPVRERMTVKIYGADSMKIAFDQRTHFFRDGREVTQMAVKPGDRVYLDTQLDQNHHIIARNVHVHTSSNPADANGQILSYNQKSGELTVQDNLSSAPVRFRVSPSTQIVAESKNGPHPLTRNQLKPGSLVSVKFAPAQQGAGMAEQVTILAESGSSFTFYGKITHLDLRNGTLAIANESDDKTYEISFDRARTPIPDDLTVGAQATIVAVFQGKDYAAQSITVSPNRQAQNEPQQQ